MHLTKLIPALTATLVLSACSTGTTVEKTTESVVQAASQANNSVEAVSSSVEKSVEVVNAVANPAAVKNTVIKSTEQKLDTHSESIIYRCLNKVRVSATYAFDGETPKAVNLLVGNKTVNGLAFDTNEKDSVAFKSTEYEWSLENSFYKSPQKSGAMLIKKGTETDEILAKLCEVDVKSTKKLAK